MAIALKLWQEGRHTPVQPSSAAPEASDKR
jgi:hypothetical protein